MHLPHAACCKTYNVLPQTTDIRLVVSCKWYDSEIWGSQGNKYEDGHLLSCCAVYSGRSSLLMFQSSLLHPSSGQWVSHPRGTSLRYRNQTDKVEPSSDQWGAIFTFFLTGPTKVLPCLIPISHTNSLWVAYSLPW